MDRTASSQLPLIVLFGVILAFLMTFIFISIYNQQLNAQVDEQANALANNLAQTAFTSLSGGQPVLELPRDVGGSTYEIGVGEYGEGSFTVIITGGRGIGNKYIAIVNASLKKIDNLSPGGRVYFRENTENMGQIIVSSKTIDMPAENVLPQENVSPPPFYDFAKDNSYEAAAIGAAYFGARELYSSDNIDIAAYEGGVVDGENLLVQITENGENRAVMQVTCENSVGFGEYIKYAWLWSADIMEDENTLNNPVPCPSPADAYHSEWLYSKQDALNHLRSRTWRDDDNTMVVIPATNVSIQAAATTTNVSTYPTWRVAFENYVIFYRMMPWWENDPDPGFVFQSYPELYPVV